LKSWRFGENPLCLRIELGDGTQFILPYGYFERARFVRNADKEILHLRFKETEFTITGSGLEELCAALQTLSVEFMKEHPRRYQALAKFQAFIEKIDIKENWRKCDADSV
jgi:hypothetical protein